MSRAKYIEENSGYYFREKPTASSNAIALTGASSVQKAIQIASGAYVTKVAVEALGTVTASAGTGGLYLQVGDTSVVGRYIIGVAGMTKGDIVVAPSIQTATDNAYFPSAASDCCAGHKYVGASSIDIKTTGSVTNAGSLKVHCWYYLD